MIKKKAKKKAVTEKTAKKGSTPKSEEEFNPAEVRKEICKMVGCEAAVLAKAVIDEGKKGQVSPVKYLFEMASIFPASADGGQPTTNEESLAQTLLRRMNLPVEPIKRDEDDEPKAAVAAAKPAVKPTQDGEGEAKDSDSEATASDESKSPVLV